MRKAIKSRLTSHTVSRRSRQGLKEYLSAPLEDVDDVVAWQYSFSDGVQYSLILWDLVASFNPVSRHVQNCKGLLCN